MEDTREKFDQQKEARVVAANPPFLIATVKLDRSEKNAINVHVHGLDHDNFAVGDASKMGAFVQVRHQVSGVALPDQFAVSILDVDRQIGTNVVMFRIKRLDSSGGWGQQLTIQILLFAG